METEQVNAVAIAESWERIGAGEAEALSTLCQEIYAQHYLHLWYDNGLWYRQMRYSSAALEVELADAQTEFYWILRDSQKAGYLKLNLDARPDARLFAPSTPGLEIERVYLYKACAGLGLGQKAMAWAETRARQLQRAYVFLYTMDSSKARLFYEKAGYLARGVKRLDFEKMKPEYRGMYLMIKELP